ncbi:MAG: acetyl-CoA carboxylase carboxyltransferase subunit alpha [Xanthomonadaceae bacterium]|nr:acetyl-CoA carboxylase carboxyltransferase subunit alpha [Xanthomonadaceae bacterium]
MSSMEGWLDFEKPIESLEKELDLLRLESKDSHKIKDLENKLKGVIEEIYKGLTPWQSVQLSRHPLRPQTRDYIENLFPDWMELHGDRRFADDAAVVGGLATLPGTKKSVMVIGQQKGRSTRQRMETHFGMAKPEGVRKGIRLMETADRLQIPVVTFVDTPGAYPGLDAEERGQAQAIAESIEVMLGIDVPTLAIIIGEGGSGGALALAAADRVLMMSLSMYSVISPESAAAILWSNSGLGEKAAEKLKIFAPDLLKRNLIDGVIKEPLGGAHRSWDATFDLVKKTILNEMKKLEKMPTQTRLKKRHSRFRAIGNEALGMRS